MDPRSTQVAPLSAAVGSLSEAYISRRPRCGFELMVDMFRTVQCVWLKSNWIHLSCEMLGKIETLTQNKSTDK